MKITMKKIALDLGISKMTVSRYFNGGYVSEMNKQKITEYLETHNYTPNFLAKNLKSKSDIIGIVAPKIDNHVFNQLVKGFIRAADENDISLLFFPTNYDSDKEDQAINSLISMSALGIIVDSNSVTIKKEKYHGVDNLVSIGLKSDFKTHISYPEHLAFKSILPTDSKTKVKFVYRNEMLSTRTEIAKQVFGNFTGSVDNILVEELDIDNSLEKDTLYVCAADVLAYELYRSANKQNLEIGKDIFVVGIGGNEINDLLSPPLTSIHFPYEDIGYDAVMMILESNYKSYSSNFSVVEGSSYKIY